jgi:hypothetical protein
MARSDIVDRLARLIADGRRGRLVSQINGAPTEADAFKLSG